MISKKNTLVFSAVCCCLLIVPVLLTVPADGNMSYASLTISGNIALVTYNISVTGIDQNDATVTWNTNGNADSTIEYGTTTGYGITVIAGGTTGNHTISLSGLLPGTLYHYRVTSVNSDGTSAISADSTFTTTGSPVTVVPTHPAGPSAPSGESGGNGIASPVIEQPQQVNPPEQTNPLQQLLAPPEQLLSGLQESFFPANNPGIGTPAASESYPIGFMGLIYNIDEHGILYVNIGYAEAARATISTYSDRVTIYQHHSPGVLLTFWGYNLTINNGNITGPVTRAEFVTDPLNATLKLGNVSGSLHAALPSIYQRFNINLSISENLSTDTLNQFQDTLRRNNLQLDIVAYTFSVQTNLTTGPENVTFTLPASWVDEHGGKDAVRITRLNEDTGRQELVNTVYEGVDTGNNMIFRGDSPNRTSLYGLVTAEKLASAQMRNIPAGTFMHNPIVPAGVIVLLLAVLVYFGWWKRRQ